MRLINYFGNWGEKLRIKFSICIVAASSILFELSYLIFVYIELSQKKSK